MAVRIGKGSNRRPRFISDAQMQANWESAFGKKKRKPKDNLVAPVTLPVDESGTPHFDIRPTGE